MAHHKPSKEELQAGIDAAAKALETPADPTPPADPVKPPDPVPPVEPAKPADPNAPVEPPADPLKPADPVPPVEEPIDWEKKAKESAKENQIVGFKSKEMAQAFEDADAIPEPTEEDMKKEFSQWDDMSDTEKQLAKDVHLNKQRYDRVRGVTEKFKKIDDWVGKVSSYLEDPQVLIDHPELEGKSDEFKSFANKPTRRGVDLDLLVMAFTGEIVKTKPAPKKGEMFPSGSGGPAEPAKPADDRLTVDQGRLLMATDYKKYKDLLLAGKIRTE